MDKTILLTGGAGYIGSHTCIELQQLGYQVLIADNLCNSKREIIGKIEMISGVKPDFVELDIRDKKAIDQLFDSYSVDAVIHFAGLKAVGESCEKPLEYYQNNVYGSINLLQSMKQADVKNIIFSSSATVYGDPLVLPITEGESLKPTNPYGQSKLMVENILRDACESDEDLSAFVLRYFNPVGAHSSGLIGEDPNGIPNNLVPYIAKVATGELEHLSVYGNDYDTSDGTGVRDYIHVVDLAKGHIAALEYQLSQESRGWQAVNLGTGQGYSVLEVIKAFEKASGTEVAYQIVDRRSGDIACCYAQTGLAQSKLGWTANLSLDQMMEDTWKWQINRLAN